MKLIMSSEGTLPDVNETVAGTVVSLSSGGYRANNKRTGESNESNDAGVVLQWLHDTLKQASGERFGQVQFSEGTFWFDTEVVWTARGTIISGKAPMQGNRFSSTEWIGRGIGENSGKGILTIGDENGQNGGHMKINNLHIETAAGDGGAQYGIYGRSAGTVYLEEIKAVQAPESGHALYMTGATNNTWDHVYGEQVAVVNSPITGQGSNEFHANQCIINPSNANVPAFTADGDGWVFTDVVVNSIDGPDLTVPLITSGRDKLQRIKWIGGELVGIATTLLDSPIRMRLEGVRMLGADYAMTNPRRVTCRNVEFTEQNKAAIRADVGIGVNNIDGCQFHDIDGSEAGAINIVDSEGDGFYGWSISDNVFNQIGNQHDVNLDFDKGSVGVTGNSMDKGVGESGRFRTRKFNLVVNNNGYNPVGPRPNNQPQIPNNLGDVVRNIWGQPAKVYHDGSMPFIVGFSGQTTPIEFDANVVEVPPNGGIGFEQGGSLPSGWVWYWS